MGDGLEDVEPLDFWNSARRIDIGRDLRRMCCPTMQFMWDNHLLAPRLDWNGSGDHTLLMGFLLGFRLRRAFLFYERDHMFYECPYCRCILVRPLAYRDLQSGSYGALVLEALPSVPEKLLKAQIPRSYLEAALALTKRRNKAGWPPKD